MWCFEFQGVTPATSKINLNGKIFVDSTEFIRIDVRFKLLSVVHAFLNPFGKARYVPSIFVCGCIITGMCS
jgi:hypothetical protein